jgi:glycine betaine/proline transport system substrate-binding protein
MTFNSQNRLVAALLIVLLLAACGGGGQIAPETAPTAEPTAVSLEGEAVIYVVAPLSGSRAEEGQSQAAGARLAAALLNEQGGVLGREIIVRTLNDQGDPAEAMNAAQTIVQNSDATLLGVVVTEASDPDLTAVREVYLGDTLARNPLVVVPASTTPLAGSVDSPLFFRLSASSLAQASEIAATLSEQNLRDAIVVHGTTGSQLALAEQFQNAAAGLNQAILDTIEVAAEETDFAATAGQIFDQNPAALFVAADPFETQQILSALYDINYQGTIYAADDALPYEVIDELGCQAEGLYRSSVLPGPTTVMTSTQFQRYATNEGRFPEPFSVAGYAAVEFIVAAYQGAGSDDPAAAATHARSNPTPTIIGDLRFDEAGNRVDANMHFQQVQGRLFRDGFERVVGTRPQTADADEAADSTFLDLTFEAGRDPVIFADLNWNSALFHNAVARFIIESGYGYPTQGVPGSTVPSFQRLTRGELDVIMERYNFDFTVEEAIASNQIVDLGVNFSDSVQGWFVPRYVVEGDTGRGIEPFAPDLRSIDDLEGFTDLFAGAERSNTGQLFGGVPGWTAYKINCMKLKAYQLDDDYALVTSGSTADLFGALDSAYDNGDPILVYLWSPTWPIARYDLVQLEEPAYTAGCWETTRGCAYPTSDVRILARADLPERAPEVAAFLEDFDMAISDVSAVLLRIEDEGLTPDEAALNWLRENEAVWSAWVPDEVAERVRAGLADT